MKCLQISAAPTTTGGSVLIVAADYKAIKSRYDDVSTTLIRQRASLELDDVSYSEKIGGSFNLLRNFDNFYHEAGVDVKQKLVGLNFLKN